MVRKDRDLITNVRAVILEQSPRGGSLLIWGIIIFLSLAVAWSSWAEIDEITRGSGKVIPSRQLQIVQNLEGGIVSKLLVQEGDIVEHDQPLLKIDDVRFSSSYREGQIQINSLQVKAARLEAETAGSAFDPSEQLSNEVPDIVLREQEFYLSRQLQQATKLEILTQQLNQRQTELKELHAQSKQLNRSYALAKRELDLTIPLQVDGAVSEVDILRLKRAVNDIYGEMQTTRLSIPRVESRLQEAERKIEELKLDFVNEARAELNDVKSELVRLVESNLALEDRVARTLVRSPVRGRINRLLINTVGGVIQPGMDLVEIVPLDDTLLVEARIRPKDIGFLHPGQEALVKFTAYDFAIYGGLDANLEYISADSITDEQGDPFYLVRVRTRVNHLESRSEQLAIIPGMLTSVDIKTGKKTVLEYLLKPVLRAKEYALKER
ncbi:HlyD family type I secretion periplasmic adaptor subunit [Solemya velesiana gill symbiont]|uniref:Membrane fusion protein (MFP) family protein n=1 Tax=Solemya velesiana gill symbiont TaxID=1918948 RepID=A0A1T2KSZ4_9GAMM|nr:HlyD family type I secretion periplasmic adaptor subunit [Solemya velesiana gill symbiont]OOZ35978.1 hemolysin secretion protein D [Solemya velesiana gill symbiont]